MQLLGFIMILGAVALDRYFNSVFVLSISAVMVIIGLFLLRKGKDR